MEILELKITVFKKKKITGQAQQQNGDDRAKNQSTWKLITRNDLTWRTERKKEWKQMNKASGTSCVHWRPRRTGEIGAGKNCEVQGARVWMSRKWIEGSGMAPAPPGLSASCTWSLFQGCLRKGRQQGCRSGGKTRQQKYKFKKILIYCRLFPHLCCNSSVLNINKYTFV